MLDFRDFLKLLKMLSGSFFTGKESFTQLREAILMNVKLTERYDSLKDIMEVIVKHDIDTTMTELRRILSCQLKETFRVYSNDRGEADFEQYIAFCADHGLYPEFASKALHFQLFSVLAAPVLRHQSWKREASTSPSRDGSILEATRHCTREVLVPVIDLAKLTRCILYIASTQSNDLAGVLKVVERIAAADRRRCREVSPERQGTLVNQVEGLLDTNRFLSPFKRAFTSHYAEPPATPTFMSVLGTFNQQLISAEKAGLR